MLSLSVNGSNVALLNRSPSKLSRNKFIPDKSSSNNASKPDSSQNCAGRKSRKYVKNRIKPKKAPPARSSFNLPVTCLPGPLQLEQSAAPHASREPPPHPSAGRFCQKTYHKNICSRSEARCGDSGKGAYPASSRSRRHVNAFHLENKTLIEIREAGKVTDFKRILSSNAILCGAVRLQASAHLAEMYRGAPVSADFTLERPHSAFSVWSVNETYHRLFQKHLDSLQSILNTKGGSSAQVSKFSKLNETSPDRHSISHTSEPQTSEELYNLSEYYEDADVTSPAPQEQERNWSSPPAYEASDAPTGMLNNFNVNLSDLILAGNKNDSRSFNACDEVICFDNDSAADIGGKGEETALSMSTTQQQGALSHCLNKRDICLGVTEIDRSLCQLNLGKGDVPQITLSECRDPSFPSNESTIRRSHSDNLSVPSVECSVESRPPLAD